MNVIDLVMKTLMQKRREFARENHWSKEPVFAVYMDPESWRDMMALASHSTSYGSELCHSRGTKIHGYDIHRVFTHDHGVKVFLEGAKDVR